MPAVAYDPFGAGAGNLLVRGAALPDWFRPGSSGPGVGRIAAGRPVDVRISAGTIAEVGPALAALRGEAVLDVPGAVVLPGLHDHHVHLRALVAAGRSSAVGPEHVAGRDELAAALRGAPVDRHGWRRAVGYHESVAGELDRWSLDTLVADTPVRVQHRSGILWTVNSAGAECLGLDAVHEPGVERDTTGRPTGRLFRLDRWLAQRLPGDDPMADVEQVSLELARRGITGVTDASPDAATQGLGALVEAVDSGRLRQRVHAMAPFGTGLPAHQLVSRGPHKVLLDDDALPALAELVELMRTAHHGGVPVAVHCVTAAQLTLALAAFAEAGVLGGDRLEHASVVHRQLVGRIAELGLAVVTNPGLVHARGDVYLEEVDARDLEFLYPCATLLRAGVAVAAGSDAPFGPVDPWTVVDAARTRRTAAGRTLVPDEKVSLATAVGLLSGRVEAPGCARTIEPGEPGDLCLLTDGVVPRPGGTEPVAAAVVAGRVVYGTS